MHPDQMLPEVVQAWPELVFPSAVDIGTTEASVMSMLWSNLVHTFLVPI